MSEDQEPYIAEGDPNFTGGLRSEVYLELLREGLIDGHAHAEIKTKDARISELEERLEINCAYRLAEDGESLERFEIAPDQRPSFPDGITARDATIKLQDEALARKDARISSLEQIVAKAFLALGEVAEVLEPLTCRSTPEHEADDAECEIDVTTGDLRKAKAVRERIMDLCHADASRADSPHRADGALQTSSEKDA